MGLSITIMAEQLKGKIIDIRREIHEHPELSSYEFNTSKLVAKQLTEAGLEVTIGVGGTGVVGLLRGKHPGKTIGLRADMDALPIKEQTNLSFSSKEKDVMHACGHDMHTAILIGSAFILKQFQEQLHGNIKFIFQPAEEEARGATNMINDGVLVNPLVDAILCLHCWPELPAGKIGIRKGTVCAATDDIEINIEGRGGHAAHPHKSIDPLPIAGNILSTLQTIVSRELPPYEPAVITIGTIQGGTASNVIASQVEMKGTVRTINHDTRAKMQTTIERIVSKSAESMNGKATLTYHYGTPPLINNNELVALAEQSVVKQLGIDHLEYLENPSLGGEDFAYYLEHVPGMLFRLGTNNESEASKRSLHNSGVIFSEEAIVPGMIVMSEMALGFLKTKES